MTTALAIASNDAALGGRKADDSRLRAMATIKPGPHGGEGKIVEADKAPVHALAEREGVARAHHVGGTYSYVLRKVIRTNVSRKSTLMTFRDGLSLRIMSCTNPSK